MPVAGYHFARAKGHFVWCRTFAIWEPHMAKEFGDARFEELEFLTRLSRIAGIHVTPSELAHRPSRDMIASLVHGGLVNDLNVDWAQGSTRDLASLQELLRLHKWQSLDKVLAGQETYLQITHSGRIRLSELRQELKRDRIRDEFGILWDKRHLMDALRIALLDASSAALLSVAFMDMNGLKTINDRHQHAAGDIAIRTYFQTVTSLLGNKGEAFRNGGDEVVVILPATEAAGAAGMLRRVCEAIMRERIQFNGSTLPALTLSVGVVTTADPASDIQSIHDLADKAMYRAKEYTKKHSLLASAISIEGQDQIQTIPIPK
jgi:diguanylate cyclase (GGDEF)-like protein